MARARLAGALILAATPATSLTGFAQAGGDRLERTLPLAASDDFSPRMIAGIDRFLDRERADRVARRERFWQRDLSSPSAYVFSVAPNRERLRERIGAVDELTSPVELEHVGGPDRPALIAESARVRIFAVRWTVFAGVQGEGLRLEPKGLVRARVVALPDADQPPEGPAGLIPGEDAWALRLAEAGCDVILPTLIDRNCTWSGNPSITMTNLPHREWIWRQSWDLGRHVIGYEVQAVRALLEWWERRGEKRPVGVAGFGEGGLVALYASALDPRIDATLVSGYFQAREETWREPIYRRVWNLLPEFGDAEIASLIAPRDLLVEHSPGPRVDGPPKVTPPRRECATPGVLVPPDFASVRSEVLRARALTPGIGRGIEFVAGADGATIGPYAPATTAAFLGRLGIRPNPVPARTDPLAQHGTVDPGARQQRRVAELGEHSQRLLRQSEIRRDAQWAGLAPAPGVDWSKAAQPLRDRCWDDVIGRLPPPSLPPNARSRKIEESPDFTIWEVTLDVWPEVFAWGYLLLPADLKPGERRPVVVCQHGLEGTPAKTIAEDRAGRDWKTYRAYARALAARGFICFAPHNPYTGGETFRQLQRKANPLGLTLYSIILGQHQRILEWLGALPYVDAQRIGFYGISYGGVSALRLPALLDGYAVSVCSAAFNDWPRKVVSPDFRAAYLFTAEHEHFSFNLGGTFGNAELAKLIAPRPFMVERGHQDGVAPDEWVAYEYAKVRRLYAQLGRPESTAIEFFTGGHEIHGVGTFDFLHQHLQWPVPARKP